MASDLKWSGKQAFNAEDLRLWYAEKGSLASKPAGHTKSANGLTFMTIEGAGELSFHFQHGVRTLMHSSAGHMVPMDKPMESEVLFKRWLEGKQM